MYWSDAGCCEETVMVQADTTCRQEDLYLQLSQILQCEISQHKQTRAELNKEQMRREGMENLVQQQAETIVRWQGAYEQAYASLEDHREQNATIQRAMEAMTAEIAQLRGVC
jgi:hypothetical protein